MSRNLLSRLLSPSVERRRQPAAKPFENLEHRVLMHTGLLQVLSVVADNRGEILITMNQPIRASNVNTGAIQMYTAGPDGILGNADDARVTTALNYQSSANRIVIRASLPAGTGYRVKLVSARMGTADGHAMLDGEFNGAFPSGNNVAGGNFEFQVKNDKSATPTVRMSTTEGVITLRMRGDVAPKTVNNFLRYANDGHYDNIFFTRNVPGFVIQGGSLQVNGSNQVVEGPVRAAVVNEFNLSNTRGTLAMAKQGGNPDSATNQFFFNLGNNSGNLDNQNGGFTVFAQVTNSSGLAVMDAIAAKQVVALRNPLTGDGVVPQFSATGVTDTPIRDKSQLTGQNQVVDNFNTERFVVTGGFNPSRDLVIVRRTAVLMRVVRL